MRGGNPALGVLGARSKDESREVTSQGQAVLWEEEVHMRLQAAQRQMAALAMVRAARQVLVAEEAQPVAMQAVVLQAASKYSARVLMSTPQLGESSTGLARVPTTWTASQLWDCSSTSTALIRRSLWPSIRHPACWGHGVLQQHYPAEGRPTEPPAPHPTLPHETDAMVQVPHW